MNDLPAWVWAANLAGFELHTLLQRAPAIYKPLFLAFDLDPGAPTDIVQGYQVTLWLRDLLAIPKLKCLRETSGSKGPQVLLPLNTSTTYE